VSGFARSEIQPVIEFIFDKARIETLLESLDTAEAIAAPAGGWREGDVVALAGVCLYQLGVLRRIFPNDRDFEHEPPERRQAIFATLLREIMTAAQKTSELAKVVSDGRLASLTLPDRFVCRIVQREGQFALEIDPSSPAAPKQPGG
jgi:hypothetical protein